MPDPVREGWCDKCRQYGPLTVYRDGALLVCAACLPSAVVCNDGQHTWRGSRMPGTWICWTCGTLKTSEAIDVNRIVDADKEKHG